MLIRENTSTGMGKYFNCVFPSSQGYLRKATSVTVDPWDLTTYLKITFAGWFSLSNMQFCKYCTWPTYKWLRLTTMFFWTTAYKAFLVLWRRSFTKRKGLVQRRYSSGSVPQKSWGTWICKFCGCSTTAICKREPQPCSFTSALRAAHVQWLACYRKA